MFVPLRPFVPGFAVLVCFIQFVPIGVFSFVRSPLFRLVFRLVVFNPMFVAHFECSQWIESEWDPSTMAITGYVRSLAKVPSLAEIVIPIQCK